MTTFHPDVEETNRSPIIRGYMRLWAAVMQRGISDYCTARTRKGYRHTSVYHWFWSNEHRTGSFCWICDLFDIDPDRARTQVLGDWRRHVDRTVSKGELCANM